MRPELQEYNYDWLMGSALQAASRVPDGTEKEIEWTSRYTPYFKPTLDTFIRCGKPGSEMLKAFATYYQNVLNAHARGQKICATTFCFSPVILYAMDIVPICTEFFTGFGNILWKRGMFDYLDYACEVGLPETSCSSQRGAMGAYLAGLGESIDMVVVDTAGVCDTNANAFSFYSAYKNIPSYILNFPQDLVGVRQANYHLDDFKELIRFLEAQTGNKLDFDRLAEVLAEVQKQDALIADIEDMHMLKPTPIPPIYNLMLYGGKYLFSGRQEYTRALEAMAASARGRAEAGLSGLNCGEEKRRAFLFYIDHYNVDMNFWNWFSENGVAHMGGMLSKHFSENLSYIPATNGSGYGIDASTPESMLDSIAQMNARMPMVRSIRGPYDQPNMWLEETLVMAEHFGAECMIYNGTPGCRNTWGNVKLMARDLEKRGYPTHIMYDDAFDDRVESWDATRGRLEEFFTIRGLL